MSPHALLPALTLLLFACPALVRAQAVEVSGLVQFDAAAYDGGRWPIDGDPGDGSSHDAGIRRGTVVLRGEAGDLQWRSSYDLHSQSWLDVGAEFSAAPGLSLRIGQFRQPGGIDAMASAATMDFIAGATASSAFATGRRAGIALSIEREGWGVDASAFSDNLNPDGARGHGLGLHGYATAAEANGTRWHTGLSLSRSRDRHVHRRVRPNADFAAAWLADNATEGADTHVLGIEAARLAGGLKLQAEYIQDRARGNAAAGHGGYVSVMWNLDGTPWNYRQGRPLLVRDSAAFWQFGLRYDHVALDRDGALRALTAGVNLYWRDFKAMFDIVAAEGRRDGIHDAARIAEARLQYTW